MDISYSPTFVKMFKTLPHNLQDEVIEKVKLFQNPINHTSLKVHKLSGRLKGRLSFSVNYKTRIVFIYLSKKPQEVFLLAVGNHDLYSN